MFHMQYCWFVSFLYVRLPLVVPNAPELRVEHSSNTRSKHVFTLSFELFVVKANVRSCRFKGNYVDSAVPNRVASDRNPMVSLAIQIGHLSGGTSG